MSRAFTLCILLLAAGLSAAGQSPAPQAPTPPLKVGGGIILGKVIEAGTTTGVSGAVVTLDSPALGSPAAVFNDGTPGGWRTVATDGQGQFVFRGLPAGAYSLSSRASGYADGEYGRDGAAQIRSPLQLRRKLEIVESDRPARTTLTMWRLGGIAGRVVDEAGEPVTGVQVTALARAVDASGPLVTQSLVVTTDDRGMYHADVPPGDYIVGLIVPTTTMPVSAVDGFVQAQREGGEIQQRFLSEVMQNGGVLSRGYGVRVGNLIVSQMMQNVPVVPPFVSDDGRQWFYGTAYHPAGSLPASAEIVTVASGEEKSGIDIRLTPAPLRRLSGRVVGPDGPIAGLAVKLVVPDSAKLVAPENEPWRAPAGLFDVARAVADGAGQFSFIGVPPGSYVAFAQRLPATADPTGPVWWAALPVTIGDSEINDLAINLQPGGRVSGRLVIESSSAPPPASALQAIRFELRPVPGSIASFGTGSAIARLDDTHRFTTRPVIPGQYSLLTTAVPAGWIVKSVSLNGKNALDNPFEVTTAGVNDLVVALSDQISTLTGTVRDANGQTPTVATVIVLAADRTLWPQPGVSSRRLQTSAADRTGRFTLRGLPAGDYLAVAVDGAGEDFTDARVLTALIPAATRVSIGEGETKSLDLRVVVNR